VQTWLPGVTGDADDPAASVSFAEDLAELEDAQLRVVSMRNFLAHNPASASTRL
jgi:hypothetical protein